MKDHGKIERRKDCDKREGRKNTFTFEFVFLLS